MTIKVHIADDHPMVIIGIKNMLADHPYIFVEQTYADGIALLEGLKEAVPDVILLDIEMPGMRGDKLAPVILKKYPDIKIIAITNFDSTLHVQYMLKHGVLGYLLKTTDQLTLIKAIETVNQGSVFLPQNIIDRLDQSAERLKKDVSTQSALTDREMEVLQLLVEGANSKEIADKLFLSLRTVNNYRCNILLKLDAKNTATLVRKALELGLIK